MTEDTKPFSFEGSPYEDKRNFIRRAEDKYLLRIQKLYQRLEEANRQLKESQIEMIFSLAIAAEYKDSDTGGHILRISDYSYELGRVIGLEDEDLDNLRYASPMHDIGKIGIPDSILKKPGKLDPKEWEVMKTHTLIGAKFFKKSKYPLLRAVSDISVSHHEKWDGSGYPYGLKGNEIPLFGRIVAVVDVFDAIVSKRCYKEKWSYEQAVEYIRSLAGNHLDPDLVNAFFSAEKKIKSIFEANQLIESSLADYDKECEHKDIEELR